MNILHIDSSILGEQSVSRSLTAAAVARLRALSPDARVVHRDLAANPIPQFSAALATAGTTPPEQLDEPTRRDAATLATVLEELLAADVIVVGAPMYNFGIPSQLKSWLDALAVPGKTFSYDENGAKGLLGDKRFVIASARGALFGEGGPYAALEHQESHLRSFLGFLGVTRIEIIRAEGVRISPAQAESAIAAALQEAGQLQAA